MYIHLKKLFAIAFCNTFFFCQVCSQSIQPTLADFDFVTTKVKNNYPAFQQKANASYYKLLNRSRKAMMKSTDPILNFQALVSPIMFFKDLHLRIAGKKSFLFDSTFRNNKLEEISRKLKNNKQNDYRMGYWKSDYDDCLIYLHKIKKGGENLLEAVVIESKNNIPQPGSIKFYISDHKIDNYFITTYINSKGLLTGVYSYFPSKDTLVTGLQYKWTKVNNYHAGYLSKLTPTENTTSLNVINSAIISIQIPKSDLETKRIVDSLVLANKSIIEKTANLVIDIRNNTGGTWAVYRSLFPYIYTNPILSGDQYRHCTEDFIEKQKESIEEDKTDSTLMQFLAVEQTDLDSMIKYKGGYYHLFPDSINFDSIKPFPKKIIVLYNYRCVSASEMFIKFCEQSKKAVTAGEKTWGAVDNVGLINFDSPTGNFKLAIPRTKNFYGGTNRFLDFTGISPHISIPNTERDWIQYLIKAKIL